jgi:hypothetical protein
MDASSTECVLNIRLAKAINDALNRSGRIFADHYHRGMRGAEVDH